MSKEDTLDPGIFFKFLEWGIDVTTATMTDSNVQKLMKSNEKFDIMLYEIFINDALLGFSQHFNIPVIGVSTVGLTPFVSEYTGTPMPNSFIANLLLGLPDEMNFKERLINTVLTGYMEIMWKGFFNPANEKLYEKYFANSKVSLQHLRKSAMTMVLSNGHISLNGPKPLMGNIIEVGGIHMNTTASPLPNDLQEFMDSAGKEGIVYFCMGSNISPKEMVVEKREAILNALIRIKQKIVWKWDHESANSVNQKKFYTSNWLPQNGIIQRILKLK